MRSPRLIVFGAFLHLLATSPIAAQDRYWDTTAGAGNGVGGSGTWDGDRFSTVATGDATLTSAGSSNTIFFQGTAGTVTLNGGREGASLRFNVTGYSIATTGSGSRELKAEGGLILANNVNLTLAPISASPLLLNANVTGGTNSSLTIGGSTSSATDSIRVFLQNGRSIASTAPITISTTGTGLAGFVVDSGSATINAAIVNNSGVRTLLAAKNGNTLSINGVISGTAGVQFDAALPGDAGTVTISAASTYTGATTINAGTVQLLTGSNRLPTGTAVTLANVSGAILALNNFSQEIGSLAGGGATGGNVTLGSGTLTISGSANTSYGGVISGTGGLTKSGSGIQTLTRANTYTGATNVNGGTLLYGVNSALAAGAVNVGGGTLDIATFNDTVGKVTLTSGTISGTTGILTSNIGVGLTAFDVQSGTISARIAGAGNLVKSTSGTVTLSGNNTYSGSTTINGGTLLANNATNSTGTGNIAVNSTGTLGGTGAVGGTGIAVNVASGGTIAPGTSTSVGTLTVNGQLSLNGTYAWNISQTAAGSNTVVTAGQTDAGSVRDLLVVGTGITSGQPSFDLNSATLSIDALGGMSVEAGKFYSWRLAQLNNSTTARVNSVVVGTTPVTSGFSITGAGAGWGNFSLTSSGGFLFLNLEAVPEPSEIALGGLTVLGIAAFLIRRRQMERRNETTNVLAA